MTGAPQGGRHRPWAFASGPLSSLGAWLPSPFLRSHLQVTAVAFSPALMVITVVSPYPSGLGIGHSQMSQDGPGGATLRSQPGPMGWCLHPRWTGVQSGPEELFWVSPPWLAGIPACGQSAGCPLSGRGQVQQ